MEGRTIHITGVVQGVGFRPYVCLLAERLELTGWTRNTSSGVDIEIDGHADALNAFVEDLNKIGMKIITRHYTQLVWAIRTGDAEMTDAGLKVLATCMDYAFNAAVAKNKPLATEALQVVVDMMWCSAKAYRDTEKAGPAGKLTLDWERA